MAQEKRIEPEKITLDDLAQMVAGGFAELHQEMRDMREGMDQKFSEVDDRLLNLERTTAETKIVVLDMQDELRATNKAIENNSHQIIGHESRITALEAVTV